MVGALQFASIVALGRIFDQKSRYNVDRVLGLAQQNKHLFSKEALAARKRKGSSTADEWLPDYLARVRPPTDKDFRRLRQLIKKHRATYEAQVRDIRHRHYAHTEVIDQGEVAAMFEKARYTDVERVVGFLNQLHEALWQVFHNGRPLRLRPAPRSSKRIARRRFDDRRTATTPEAMVKDTRRLLRMITEVVPKPSRRTSPKRVELIHR